MRLAAMVDGLRNQMTQPEIAAMPFEERLAVLVDLQHSAMLNAALAQRLKRAGMRQTACIENLDLRTRVISTAAPSTPWLPASGCAKISTFWSSDRPESGLQAGSRKRLPPAELLPCR